MQGVQKKSGVLVWNFNFKRNMAVKVLHFCSFQSLFIQLSRSYGGQFAKFGKRAAELCLSK